MSSLPAEVYWERRARDFAGDGAGLGAVCSYGMPAFYNRAIEWSQRLALRRWLRVPAGTRALDVGCGIGRWSRALAARGASVTGVDLSPFMVGEAERRTAAARLDSRCRFEVSDLATLDLGRKFDFALGVTVLQHILEADRVAAAFSRLRDHLVPGGRLVLLEAAPSRRESRCDSPIFKARALEDYRELWQQARFDLSALVGVDPMPFKILFLPHYRRLPRVVSNSILALLTAVSLPIDATLGRRLVSPSWHKVMVLEARE